MVSRVGAPRHGAVSSACTAADEVQPAGGWCVTSCTGCAVRLYPPLQPPRFRCIRVRAPAPCTAHSPTLHLGFVPPFFFHSSCLPPAARSTLGRSEWSRCWRRCCLSWMPSSPSPSVPCSSLSPACAAARVRSTLHPALPHHTPDWMWMFARVEGEAAGCCCHASQQPGSLMSLHQCIMSQRGRMVQGSGSQLACQGLARCAVLCLLCLLCVISSQHEVECLRGRRTHHFIGGCADDAALTALLDALEWRLKEANNRCVCSVCACVCVCVCVCACACSFVCGNHHRSGRSRICRAWCCPHRASLLPNSSSLVLLQRLPPLPACSLVAAGSW